MTAIPARLAGFLSAARSHLLALGPALLAGLGLALVAPPFGVFAAVPIGLAAFAVLLERLVPTPQPGWRKYLQGAGTGVAFGTAVNTVALSFVPSVIVRFTPLPWAAGVLALLLLSALQSAVFAVTGALTVQLRRLHVPSPLAFAMAHFVGLHAPGVFPWTVAAGLTPHPWAVQSAELFGERGVAALWTVVASLLAGLYLAARRRRSSEALGRGVVATLLVTALYLHGRQRIEAVAAQREQADGATLGLVHPSYPATLRWETSARQELRGSLHTLTQELERRGVELTVWPEGAHPYSVPAGSTRDVMPPRSILGDGVRGPVLAGAMRRLPLAADDPDPSSTNSAILVERDGSFHAPYDKVHLLAFGEHVPLADYLPWIRRTFARGLGLVAGDHAVTQSLSLGARELRMGVLICFEDTLPEAARGVFDERAGGAPNLLVNLTNDAWFADTIEPRLHLQLGSLRAVETRRDLVRAVNLGYTGLVAATGEVEHATSDARPRAVTVQPRLLDGPATPFVRHGELPFTLLGLAACVGGALFVRRRGRRAR